MPIAVYYDKLHYQLEASGIVELLTTTVEYVDFITAELAVVEAALVFEPLTQMLLDQKALYESEIVRWSAVIADAQAAGVKTKQALGESVSSMSKEDRELNVRDPALID